MKGYELIQKMVDELAHGSPIEFAEKAGLSANYVAVNRLMKTARLTTRTPRRIESAYKIRVIAQGKACVGWVPESPVAFEVEEQALKFKAELRAIVEETEAKIDALLGELKEL